MVLPQAMAWVQYWFRILSLKFCGKSKKNCGDISQVSPAFCMYVRNPVSAFIYDANHINLSEVYFTIKTTDPVHSCHQNVTEQGWTFYQKCFQKHHRWANCLSLYSHFFHLLNCVSKLANWESVQSQLESDSWYLWQLERLKQRADPEWGSTWSFHIYEVGTSNVQLKIFITICTKSVSLLPLSNFV